MHKNTSSYLNYFFNELLNIKLLKLVFVLRIKTHDLRTKFQYRRNKCLKSLKLQLSTIRVRERRNYGVKHGGSNRFGWLPCVGWPLNSVESSAVTSQGVFIMLLLLNICRHNRKFGKTRNFKVPSISFLKKLASVKDIIAQDCFSNTHMSIIESTLRISYQFLLYKYAYNCAFL